MVIFNLASRSWTGKYDYESENGCLNNDEQMNDDIYILTRATSPESFLLNYPLF